MGHNYGKHFNNPNNNHNPLFMGQKVNDVDNVNELPSENQNDVEPVVNEVIKQNNEEVVNEVHYVDGVVSGCDKLNVRAENSKESEVLCIIDKDTALKVDLSVDDSANKFYKIVTPSGVEGYCMKKFITIK